MLDDIRMDDIARLRKPHPCGGYEWRVVRIGADIGLKCLTCDHRVLLSRRDFEKRLKAFVARGPATSPALLRALQSDPQPEQDD